MSRAVSSDCLQNNTSVNTQVSDSHWSSLKDFRRHSPSFICAVFILWCFRCLFSTSTYSTQLDSVAVVFHYNWVPPPRGSLKLFVRLWDHSGVFFSLPGFKNGGLDFCEGVTLMTHRVTPSSGLLVACSLISHFRINCDHLERRPSTY